MASLFDQVLVSNSTPIAAYQGPAPPAGDSAHTYAFYLFQQPSTFILPEAAGNGNGNFTGVLDGRINFNITQVVEAAGQPIAATYLLAQANATGITDVIVDEPATSASASSGSGSSPVVPTSPTVGAGLTGAATGVKQGGAFVGALLLLTSAVALLA